jgi:tRNA (cytidine/uridine-2'-O-)-methyltransferase
MIDVALFEPEIPPNTGNIIRLCANTGSTLHLIHPLGFRLDDKKMRRAGLDYHEFASIVHYDNMADFMEKNKDRKIITLSTHGTACYSDLVYQNNDILLFGAETRGIPEYWRDQLTLARIPMKPESRSLNLSNTVAIVLYEAIRQLGFSGMV